MPGLHQVHVAASWPRYGLQGRDTRSSFDDNALIVARPASEEPVLAAKSKASVYSRLSKFSTYRLAKGSVTMGSLTRFDLAIYDCDIFFETGTGTGASLLHALNNGRFEKIYSVEIHPKTAERAYLRFQEHANQKIINSDSASALRSILPQIHADIRILLFFRCPFPRGRLINNLEDTIISNPIPSNCLYLKNSQL